MVAVICISKATCLHFCRCANLNNTETGEITADQEVYIDTLLAKYNMTEFNPNKVPHKTSVNLDEIAV